MAESIMRHYLPACLLTLFYIYAIVKLFKKDRTDIFILSAGLFIFLKFSIQLVEQELYWFDGPVYRFVSGFISKSMTEFMIFVSGFGSVYVLSAISAFLILALWKKKKDLFYGCMAVADLFSALLINTVFKYGFHRERPDIRPIAAASGYSFPSGHSMIGLCFYGFLIYLCHVFVKKPYRWWIDGALSLLILSIGISRVYLGVHYASDVAAGFSAGLAWLAIFIMIVKRLDRTRKSGDHKKESKHQ